MTEGALDKFGELLMTRIRDAAIVDWDKIVDGKMKDAVSQRVARAVADLGPDAKGVIRQLIPQIVDTTLHHLLWTLEQEPSLHVTVENDDGDPVDVAEESDGLTGDLYDWLPRFSTQRYQNPADPQ
jgi:hypothetical protein